MATRAQRRLAPCLKPEQQDDDSDTELSQLGLKKPDGRESQIIHSGHFMVSTPHVEHPPKKGYDFDTVNKQTCQTYHFGKASSSHFSIDASLTKLFECMTLAYSGRLVSPKWKNFKGLKLLWRDKIRLNNAIWRAWYIQYVEKRDNPVCHFVTPLDGSMDSGVHRPTEAIAIEGKYWKRRIEIVLREYHKWRTYFKKRLQKHKDDDLSSLLKGAEEQFSLFGEVHPDTLRMPFYQADYEDAAGCSRRCSRKSRDSPIPMDMDTLFDMDVLMSEFSDTLFSTLSSHQPVAWPNPREIAHAGNADMIQPGLIPLQPNLDFMDTFEPLQDLFHTLRQPFYTPASPTTLTITSLTNSNTPTQTSMPSSISLSTELSIPPGPISPSVRSQDNRNSVSPVYQHDYMPNLARQVSSSTHSTSSMSPSTSSVPVITSTAPLPSSVPQSLNGQAVGTISGTPCSSTITYSIPSLGTSSSQSSNSVISSKQSQVHPLPSTSLPPQQNFALPRPIQSAAKKNRHVPVVPANLLQPSHLILAGPAGAVLVAPSTLKTEIAPASGVVITSANITCGSGLHILKRNQKSPQHIVPKEEASSTVPSNKSIALSCTDSSLGSEQVPSPQSPLNCCTIGLAKHESSENRRVKQKSAEQKRRSNINSGFKTLCTLVPTLKMQANISNATTLQKTVEYIGKLQQERHQIQEETRRLREEIEELNASINLFQEQLPETGVPITSHRFDHMKKFDNYVKSRTLQNWKFWIVSFIITLLTPTIKSTTIQVSL